MKIRFTLIKKGNMPRLLIEKVETNAKANQKKPVQPQPARKLKKEGILEKAEKIQKRVEQELTQNN